MAPRTPSFHPGSLRWMGRSVRASVRARVLWVGVALLGTILLGAAPAPCAAQAAEGTPLVLSVEGAGARLSVTRLRRALSAALARPVLRMTDSGACDADGTLHIAFSGPRSWIVRLDSGSGHLVRTVEVRGPALETLVGVAVDMIHRAASEPAVAHRDPAASTSSSGRYRSVVAEPWADSPSVPASEILDPFAGMPVARVAIFASSELLDPFTAMGASVRAATTPEVLDPWR